MKQVKWKEIRLWENGKFEIVDTNRDDTYFATNLITSTRKEGRYVFMISKESSLPAMKKKFFNKILKPLLKEKKILDGKIALIQSQLENS